MSILILGKTICPICQKTINNGDEYYSFPAFVINIKDPLYFFSDATFHLACLGKDKLGKTAIKYAELFVEKVKPTNRKSLISGRLINEPQNHIFIDYLSPNTESYLYQFNFTHIDKRDLKSWKEKDHLERELKKLRDSGEWEEINGSKYLDNLIGQMT